MLQILIHLKIGKLKSEIARARSGTLSGKSWDKVHWKWNILWGLESGPGSDNLIHTGEDPMGVGE